MTWPRWKDQGRALCTRLWRPQGPTLPMWLQSSSFLDETPLTENGYSMGVSSRLSCPQGHWAKLGGIFGCHNSGLGAAGTWQVGARDAVNTLQYTGQTRSQEWSHPVSLGPWPRNPELVIVCLKTDRGCPFAVSVQSLGSHVLLLCTPACEAQPDKE